MYVPLTSRVKFTGPSTYINLLIYTLVAQEPPYFELFTYSKCTNTHLVEWMLVSTVPQR
jgi:hypothetical protein